MRNEEKRGLGIGGLMGLVLMFFGIVSMVALSLLLGFIVLIFGGVLFYVDYTHRKANVPASAKNT